MAKAVKMTDYNFTRYAILKGLKPQIRCYVLQNNAKTVDEVLRLGHRTKQTVTNDTLATSAAQEHPDHVLLVDVVRNRSRVVRRSRLSSPVRGHVNQWPRFKTHHGCHYVIDSWSLLASTYKTEFHQSRDCVSVEDNSRLDVDNRLPPAAQTLHWAMPTKFFGKWGRMYGV